MEALYWIINIVLILGALAVITLVILQKGSQGGGLGAVFGGGSTDNFLARIRARLLRAK